MQRAAPPAEGRAPAAGRGLTIWWRGTAGLLAAALVAIWHISLLWLYRDRPGVLAGGLLGVFLLVVAARAIARAAPPGGRSHLMHHTARLNGTALVFVAFLLVLLLVFHLGFERAASDGRSYFIQVRSLVMDRDLDFANDEAAFGGHGAAQYAFGAPLLWSPIYVLGHLWLKGLSLIGADVRTDGYYFPYQRAVGLATLLYGFAGLVLIYRVLRAYFARGLAALATMGLCLTSFLVWYLTVENSMSHGVSMFAATLFLFLWHRFRPAPSLRQWAWLGAAAGLMAMARWQNAVFVIFPLIDLLWPARRAMGAGETGAVQLRATARNLATFAAAAVVAFAPQLLAWQAIYGNWLHVPAREHNFEPALVPPFLADVLFSSNRGLLTWTPVIWIALPGLAYFGWRHWRVGLVLAGALAAQIWVNAGVEVWWGGAGFGARRFDSCMLIFAVGLAASLTAFQRRPLLLPAAALGALLALNVVFMLGYRGATLPQGEGIPFRTLLEDVYDRLGNPFSLPAAAYVAWRYDVGLPVYDLQRGRTYSDLTIDVGSAEDERFLGRGWGDREQSPAFSFRWANAITSTVLVPLKAPATDYVLEIEWGPFSGPGVGPQVVQIELNGGSVGSATLAGGVQQDRIDLPVALLRTNLNQLRFRYQFAVSPKSLGLSDDARTLAVQVNRLRLRPRSGSGP